MKRYYKILELTFNLSRFLRFMGRTCIAVVIIFSPVLLPGLDAETKRRLVILFACIVIAAASKSAMKLSS